MPLRADYAGPFDPSVGLADFSRQMLADLGREYLLNGHLQDRVGLPLVAKRFGGDAYVRFSIEEWMGASPIYSLRMQRALGFEGHDVGTVFKNLQLDIGAPHQFMDFQFRLDAPDYGEFWLPHCGALLDVEPFGEKRVKFMCHDIEDPTFDATAAATHPNMKMRPIHRPPRVPIRDRVIRPAAGRSSSVSEATSPTSSTRISRSCASSKLADAPRSTCPGDRRRAGRLAGLLGALRPGLPARGSLAPGTRRHEPGVRRPELPTDPLLHAVCGPAYRRGGGRRAWALRSGSGIAALTAGRLHEALGIGGDDIEAIVKVFQLHPGFHPRSYVDFRVEITDARRPRASPSATVRPSGKRAIPYSWFAALGAAPHPALDAIAGAVNPRAHCHPVPDPMGAHGSPGTSCSTPGR